MLYVKEDVCVGCGLCARVCPKGAISIIFGKAHIDEEKCIQCNRCQEVCPRGAIVESVEAVSLGELKGTFQGLEKEVNEILHKIENLEKNLKK
ncbi:MAG: hypothetical protein B5M53_06790 [Candidatus Cloacimonas sp. 4484_209]|nr:MAG: hypothetical protein B5M53_06790 [Candidatus Cloacimonas sp. 4484_209]